MEGSEGMNKEETKIYNRKYYDKHQDKYRETSRLWYENNHDRKLDYCKKWRSKNNKKTKKYRTTFNNNHPGYIKDWIKNNAEKASIIFKRYREKNRFRIKAQKIAAKAYPIRQICSVASCNELGEKHHLDYNKPLEILWLCRKHHKEIHKNIL